MKKKPDSGNLSGSEKKYRALFDNAPIGISIVDINRKILEANKALEKVTSLSKVELDDELYKRRRYIRSDGSEMPEDELPSALSMNKGSPVIDIEIGIKSGEKIIAWTQVSAAPVELPEKCAVVITQDITERKNLESRLKASERKYRAFFDNSIDAILITSQDGSIYSANNGACKMLDRSEEEICRLGRNGIVEQTAQLDEALRRRRATGHFLGELRFIKKDGTRFPVEISSSLFVDSDGRELTTIIARDITLRKKMETKLKISKKRLEKLNQHLNEIRENERSEIALNLHDDLGQRLTALCLDIAWFKSRIGVQSTPVRNKLEEMIREINETIEGIKELSSFLRPTILYDLGLVPAIISQLDKFEKQSGIKCSFNFDSEEFNSDEKISLIFYRIIQESLTNIARHSGASAMELSLKKHKDAIEMVLKDDGVGIDNEKVNYLTSMGLEGIRERVKTAHGEVSIKGEKGSGTTIMVTIPIKKRRR